VQDYNEDTKLTFIYEIIGKKWRGNLIKTVGLVTLGSLSRNDSWLI